MNLLNDVLNHKKDLSELSSAELRQLQTNIEFLLELQANFTLVPITHKGD